MSGIDLSQFHQVFFEESFEGLEAMENGLLNIDLSAVDSETINTIFRAAHSIKGGSGTFGFSDVANFTHVVETLLDEIREGSRSITRNYVDLFLQSVDCLRTMLESLQADNQPDLTDAMALKEKFEAILNSEAANGEESSVAEDVSPAEDHVADKANRIWHIVFVPGADLFRTGNEPVRIIRELSELGELLTLVHTQSIPDLDAIDPESCYLHWEFALTAAVERVDIEEVFEWVIDDVDLKMELVSEIPSQFSLGLRPDIESVEEPAASEPADLSPPTPTEEPKVEPSLEVPAQTSSKPVLKAAAPANKAAENQSIRVSIDKVDALINMVGELVITQSMLGQIGKDFDMSRLNKLQEGLAQLEQNTREMQESVMRIRMLPISFSFNRFPRLVRDISEKLGKKVNLQLLGEQTELDKTVMEKIGDPLVHMVRNSLDHGIERPDERLAKGKLEAGTLTLNAYHQGGNIIIEISDDGKGIDPDIMRTKALSKGLISSDDNLSDEQAQELIFMPGFSTAEAVSDLSGRGVGMDVVKRNIQELNGSVELDSEVGRGSIFRIRLPLTLAILDGQLVRVGNETYILPLVSIVESIELQQELTNQVAGDVSVFRQRHEYIPIIKLYELFHTTPDSLELSDGLLVISEGDNKKVGLLVDELLGQQQVVIKSLESNYRKVEGVSGATILGDGTVALILDIPGLIKLAGVKTTSNIDAA